MKMRSPLVTLAAAAADGVVTLANKDRTSRLMGRPRGDTVVGTLSIGQKRWDFTTAAVQPPAGLYVYQEDGVRSSWIVDGEIVTGCSAGPHRVHWTPNPSPWTAIRS